MSEEFFVKKNRLEEITDTTTIDDIIKVYKNNLDSNDIDEELRKYFIWDYELLCCYEKTMGIENAKGNRLGAYIEYTNGYKYPDIDSFEEERIEFYDKCLKHEININKKIRYLDYLVDYGAKSNKYVYACQLIDLLIENNKIEDYNDDTECLNYISKLSRAVNISTSYGMNEKISILESNINDIISKFVEVKSYRWILEISEQFRYLCYNKKNKRISQDSINSLIEILEICKEFYKEEKNINLHQSFCYEFYEWIKREDSSDSRIKQVLLEIGQSFEDEAEYQGGREEKSNLVKAHFLECAVNHYANIGARDKVYNLKVKIKEAYRLAKDEVKEYEYNLDIPNFDKFEEEAERFIFDDIDSAFEVFSRVSIYNFIPKIEKIINMAKDRQENSLMNLVGISKISNDRKVFDANSEDEREKYFLFEQYNIWLQLMFSIMYDKIWIKLKQQGLNCEMIVDRITGWECMSETDADIIKVGIERYFNEDFISAIHILVPKFESCFREFFSWGGYPTTSIKKSATQHEQTFNEFLENDFVKENIDSDTLFLIKYVMVENLGFNLRNDIAHGLAGADKFSKNIANIVLWLYFILTDLGWRPKEIEDKKINI
ncbi:MAG: DUF4209 domain-containing protein [Clostridium perfringens]|nr:DUF4209 domain-containing protein [Clostridium perfringens]